MTDRIYNVELPTAPMKAVALKLAHHADENGCNTYPSARTIALGTKLSLSTVRDALAELEASGVIVEVQKGNGIERASTKYRFNLEIVGALPSLSRERGQLKLVDGTLRWVQVDVPVIDIKTGAPKLCDKTGLPKIRKSYRLAPFLIAQSPSPVRVADPSPSATRTGCDAGDDDDPIRVADSPRPGAGLPPVRLADPNHHQESNNEKESGKTQEFLVFDDDEREGGLSVEGDDWPRHQPKIRDVEWLPTAFPLVHTSQLITGIQQIALDFGEEPTNAALQKLRARVSNPNLARVSNPIPYLRKTADDIASAGRRPGMEATAEIKPSAKASAQLLRSLEPRRAIGGMR